MNPTQTIEKLASGSALSQREAYEMQSAILRGEVQTSALFEYFSALGARPPTSEELRGFFKASLEAMTPLTTDIDTLDTCGTGGDGSGSFNISTAAAILCAATGVSVTKHGNRAASSTCGSADVLEALGVKIELSPIAAKRVLTKCGFVFLFARSYHPAFRHAAEARKAYGRKTYFNLLGPLLNPARAAYRVHGLADFSLAPLLGEILIESGVKRALLVHADDGLDEVSPASTTNVLEYSPKPPKALTVNPRVYRLFVPNRAGLAGGDAKANADIMRMIFAGRGNEAQNAAVILNAAAGLYASGRVRNLEEGTRAATAALMSGEAERKLAEIILVTNEAASIL